MIACFKVCLRINLNKCRLEAEAGRCGALVNSSLNAIGASAASEREGGK